MNEKRKNPYQRLMEEIKEFCDKVKYRHTAEMFYYPKEKLAEVWGLSSLWERTYAAEQLGYDVVLTANEKGIIVRYVKKIPSIPYHWL